MVLGGIKYGARLAIPTSHNVTLAHDMKPTGQNYCIYELPEASEASEGMKWVMKWRHYI